MMLSFVAMWKVIYNEEGMESKPPYLEADLVDRGRSAKEVVSACVVIFSSSYGLILPEFDRRWLLIRFKGSGAASLVSNQ